MVVMESSEHFLYSRSMRLMFFIEYFSILTDAIISFDNFENTECSTLFVEPYSCVNLVSLTIE